MKSTRTLAALLLLSALLALSACTGGAASGPSTPASQQPAGETQLTAQPPTIELTEPLAGATVPAGNVSVKVNTTNLQFTMPSNTNVAGQGHVHFTLDDKPFQMSVEPQYTFKDVAPGPHTLKAELVQNDTKSFDPPVEQVIEFTVQ